jgi:hypothetical protein
MEGTATPSAVPPPSSTPVPESASPQSASPESATPRFTPVLPPRTPDAPPPRAGGRRRSLMIALGLVVAAAIAAAVIYGVTRDAGGSVATADPNLDTTIAADSGTVALDPNISDPDAVETLPAESAPADTDIDTDIDPDIDPDTRLGADTTNATTTPAAEGPDTTEAGEGDGNELTSIPQLVSWTSFSELPLSDDQRTAEIDRLIAARTVEAVASPGTVAEICAGIPVGAPIDLVITWQYLGETIQHDERQAVEPGVGSCIDNAGEPLKAGSYQVFAANADESELGFATTFVVGANPIEQLFTNNSETDICDIGVAPVDTSFYEFFTSTSGPILSGEQISIQVAGVEQDLRARTCSGGDLESLTFTPSSEAAQNLSL